MPKAARRIVSAGTMGDTTGAPRGGTTGGPDKAGTRLGEVLMEHGQLSGDQLREGLRLKAKERMLLGQALCRLGYVTEEQVAQAVAAGSGLEYVNLEEIYIEPLAAAAVPAPVAQRYGLVPLRLEEDLQAAVDRPPAPQAIKNIERLAKRKVQLAIGTTSKIKDALARLYDKGQAISVQDGSAVELVNDMINRALRIKASDIHLEPYEDSIRLRLRVDGILQDVERYGLDMLPSLTSRIKVMAGLNIAERRSPQDGALLFEETHDPVDLRVSTLPTVHGEKIVMRILAGQSNRLMIDQLGLSDTDRQRFAQLIKRPYGIICIVGPTGSGKSTTLCAALNTINRADINITTVEDPVEYKIDGVNQVQVSRSDKITFAGALRSILRQDPDVIMVGETRDQETATISLRAALTGHLVFTTLHTNDAPGALPRLVDMGCEPFLVGSSVSGILAQRLVRTLCPKCKQAYQPTPEEAATLGVEVGNSESWYRAKGCPSCLKTGYRGRLGIFELLLVDDNVRAEVMAGSTAEAIRDAALKQDMVTLRQDALAKVQAGITSVEEVMRVTVDD